MKSNRGKKFGYSLCWILCVSIQQEQLRSKIKKAMSSPVTSTSSSSSFPIYGSIKCMATLKSTGMPCAHGAYYIEYQEGYGKIKKSTAKFYCGQHTKSRLELPKLSAKAKREAESEFAANRNEEIEAMRLENVKNGQSGKVSLKRLKSRSAIEYKPGYLAVFPNFKHGNRSDGFGCATLSPMGMGPIHHKQRRLPPAKNLENFYQFSKQFPDEDDDDFLKAQIEAFEDETPHRHKIKGIRPLGWVWVDPKTNKRYVLPWVPSRQFYCNFYERFAKLSKEFKILKEKLANGTCLEIHGYDAYPIEDNESITDAYLQSKVPFGHERVLYTMLVEPDETKWPWRVYKTFEF